MTPAEKLHAHHEKLIGTIRNLGERVKNDNAETSLLLTFCGEYLVSHAEAEEVTLYKAYDDVDFVGNMVHEHEEIKHSLGLINTAYGRGDSSALVPEVKNFLALLGRHFDEEENTLMPELSKKLSRQELESLIAEAHRIEAEKKKSDVWLLFENDHKRIDFNISRLRKSAADPDAAARLYSKVRAQLLKHVELEETILFPAFAEHAAPGQTGPVQVMIAEHREITSLIASASDMLDQKSLSSNIDALVGKLAVHNKKEELILYPLINRTLTPADREKVYKECFEGLASV